MESIWVPDGLRRALFNKYGGLMHWRCALAPCRTGSLEKMATHGGQSLARIRDAMGWCWSGSMEAL